jgi:hypothetical protein
MMKKFVAAGLVHLLEDKFYIYSGNLPFTTATQLKTNPDYSMLDKDEKYTVEKSENESFFKDPAL